jgi:aerobic carbon-monoxide dehydrogenase medium subunit
MKAARFDYRRAESVDDALRVLAESGGSAKAMSGAQSLGPMLNLRLARPETVVDIARLPALRDVVADATGLRIGAAVTHAQIEDGVFDALRGHPMQRVAAGIAFRSVRNRGTLGGSLAHADPAADWMVVLAALGAEVAVASLRGERRVPMQDFMQGAYTTALAADELVVAVHLAHWPASARFGYDKICRKPGEFAEASCAACFDPAARVATIVLGALDGAPQALPALAQAVARDGAVVGGREAILRAVRAALPDKDDIDCGLHATAVERCLAQAFEDEASTR